MPSNPTEGQGGWKPIYGCPECGFWSGAPHHKGDPCWNRSQHGGKKGPPLELVWYVPAHPTRIDPEPVIEELERRAEEGTAFAARFKSQAPVAAQYEAAAEAFREAAQLLRDTRDKEQKDG